MQAVFCSSYVSGDRFSPTHYIARPTTYSCNLNSKKSVHERLQLGRVSEALSVTVINGN